MLLLLTLVSDPGCPSTGCLRLSRFNCVAGCLAVCLARQVDIILLPQSYKNAAALYMFIIFYITYFTLATLKVILEDINLPCLVSLAA